MEVTQIKYLCVHSSHTPDDDTLTPEALIQKHKARGAKDCKHHYIIDRDGTEVKGRNITQPGIGTEEHNLESISICLMGTSNYTQAQKRGLRKSLVSLRDVFIRAKVVGHDEIEPEVGKDCPGFSVKKWFYKDG